jgi:hypothetical protein
MLAHNIRVEEDLIDQLFNSSEKRLARALLLLARYGEQEQPDRILAKVSQETLAKMVGTTRSRVNFFMNKFRKLGFIEYNGKIKINKSLLTVVLHESAASLRIDWQPPAHNTTNKVRRLLAEDGSLPRKTIPASCPTNYLVEARSDKLCGAFFCNVLTR